MAQVVLIEVGMLEQIPKDVVTILFLVIIILFFT